MSGQWYIYIHLPLYLQPKIVSLNVDSITAVEECSEFISMVHTSGGASFQVALTREAVMEKILTALADANGRACERG